MLTAAENETLTRTGPDTPMGRVFRRFWMPALLSRELPEADGPPRRLRLLGEDFVAFRDSNDRVGIVDPRCPHRGANLFFGRTEACGIRCSYHGWKFDVTGACVDVPTSAPGDRGAHHAEGRESDTCKNTFCSGTNLARNLRHPPCTKAITPR